MSEDQDLLAKISQLAGHINLHKTQQPSDQNDVFPSHSTSRGHTRGSTSWRQPRGTPYSRARGRGGRTAPPAHRNRTLVLNGNTVSTGILSASQHSVTGFTTQGSVTNNVNENEPPPSATGWIAKRDRHMQLINTSIYDKETQLRARAMEETRKLKAQQRDEREKAKISRHLHRLASQSVQPTGARSTLGATVSSHEVTINGLRFRVANGGSRLVRVSGRQACFVQDRGSNPDSCALGDLNGARSTPKKANIGGVTFLRSKTGNLYRSGLVRAKK
ncbi:MAG: hypothetical protein M1830_004196 [Pleopsidium flavum]|nr:MAG: hypothetical protein M1830_004196 [Pleopsidium flavum]